MSRRELADAANVVTARLCAERETRPRWQGLNAATIAELERGERRWPNAEYREALTTFLDMSEAQLGFYIDRPPRAAVAVHLPPSPPQLDHAPAFAQPGSPIGRLPTSNVSEATLAYLEAGTASAISESERVAPYELLEQVVALHHHVEYLLHGIQHPPQRARLYAVGVYVSGLLGTLALDSGRWAPARIYTQNAYDLAVYAERSELQSWARATQSLVAYYAGDYRAALDLARDGQRRSHGGVHSVRLAINGEARALARLGDSDGVDDAVDRAFDLLASHPAAEGMSPSLALGVYCHARSAANAATAYLVLGEPTRVDDFVQVAINAFDAAGLRGPQSLSRLDLATALLLPGGDLDRACSVAIEALTVSSADPFESVALRAGEFVGAAPSWQKNPTVRGVRELLASYRSTGRDRPFALPSADVDDRAGQP